jgi:hypothetical protein
MGTKQRLNSYRFRSVWLIGAPPADVFAVLEVTETYPQWWPEVRRVVALDAKSRRMTVRSLLPYDLDFVTTRAAQDAEAGLLEATMAGDLEGFSRWTIRPSATGTTAVFEEEVDATKPLLRRLALVARPAFQANHALMMRNGQRGLRTYLAGLAAGRDGLPAASD